MSSVIRGAGLLSLACGLMGAAVGQPPKGEPLTDNKFIVMAGSGGLMEVELGKVAGAKAADDGVKKFGEMMVKDHSKANKQLAAVARKLDRPEPKEMTDKHARVVERLKGLSGRAFDRAYVKQMVEDHEEDVALFARASKECKAAELKKFAADALPTLQKHLEMAKELQERLGKK
ncbi:MAG: DUF4142 domain-containing protein [Gemmataceae bacterium]